MVLLILVKLNQVNREDCALSPTRVRAQQANLAKLAERERRGETRRGRLVLTTVGGGDGGRLYRARIGWRWIRSSRRRRRRRRSWGRRRRKWRIPDKLSVRPISQLNSTCTGRVWEVSRARSKNTDGTLFTWTANAWASGYAWPS